MKRRVEGEVRFDKGSKALYASDLSMYRQVPVGVVIPRTYDDVIQTLAACRDHNAPILGRGCGTSLAGQCCDTAVIINFSKYLNKILANSEDGKRLAAQTKSFGEFLSAARYKAPAMKGKALLHGHCHQKALGGNFA